MKIKNVHEALKEAKEDETVKIRLVPVAEGKDIGYHVAEIKEKVQAHVHTRGDELYHILKGEGTMHVGEVIFEGNEIVKVEWEKPMKVKEHDVFNIPEGYAHCLENTGSVPLVIGFICPHSHLTEEDRVVVENP